MAQLVRKDSKKKKIIPHQNIFKTSWAQTLKKNIFQMSDQWIKSNQVCADLLKVIVYFCALYLQYLRYIAQIKPQARRDKKGLPKFIHDLMVLFYCRFFCWGRIIWKSRTFAPLGSAAAAAAATIVIESWIDLAKVVSRCRKYLLRKVRVVVQPFSNKMLMRIAFMQYGQIQTLLWD